MKKDDWTTLTTKPEPTLASLDIKITELEEYFLELAKMMKQIADMAVENSVAMSGLTDIVGRLVNKLSPPQ